MDSNDFHWRINTILQNQEFYNISFNSKIGVDILMAIESDLKSLIISLSKKDETPEEAYLTARKCGHNLKKLYDNVELRAKNRLKLLTSNEKKQIIGKFDKLRVSNRYKIISLLKIRNEDPWSKIFGFGEFSSILDIDNIEKTEKIALKLHQIARISIERNSDPLSMNGKNLHKYHDRIFEFESNLRGKL